MSQHETNSKRRNRRDRKSGRKGDSRSPTEQPNNQLVNKIASIDIWATERLYEKWRQQAFDNKVKNHKCQSKTVKRSTLYSHNGSQSTCQRHGGDVSERYFTASLAKPSSANLGKILTIGDPSTGAFQAQHSKCHREHRAESRPAKSRRRPEKWYFLQNHTQRRLQSLSSERGLPIYCQCYQQKGDDSDRFSDADTPNSWTPIWGSSALNVMCVDSNSENLANRTFTDEIDIPKKFRRQQHSLSRPRKPGLSRKKKPTDELEAIITLNRQERKGSKYRPKSVNRRVARIPRSEKNRDRNLARCKPAVLCCLSSNSIKQRASRSETRSQLLNKRVCERQTQNSMDQSTRTIIRDISCTRSETQSSTKVRYIDGDTADTDDTMACDYGIARICKTKKCLFEKVESLPKPEVWLMAEQLTPSVHASSKNEGSTVRLSETQDNKTLSSSTFVTSSAVRKAKEGARQVIMNKQKIRPSTLRDLMGCNNSVDGKSLQMLSTISNDSETETHPSGSLSDALVSKVKLPQSLSVAKCSLPNVRMQSNTSMAKGTIEIEFGYYDSSNLMEHNIGKTVIAKPNTDSSTTGTTGTDTVRDQKERRMRTDSQDRDLGEKDKSDEKLDSEESNTGKGKTPLRQPAKSKEGRNRAKQGGDLVGDESSSSQQASVSKRLLSMTECPTTRHRIECYRTRSGRVKCYMTARHPVKCRIDCGRIVCKATVNSEPSELPHLCDAEWQCQN